MAGTTPLLARQILAQIARGGRPPRRQPAKPADRDILPDRDTLEEERREVLEAALAVLRSAREGPDFITACHLMEHLAAQPDGVVTSTSRRSR